MKKGMWALIIFSVAYIAAFFLRYVFQKNYEFMLYGVVVIIVALVVLLTLKQSGLDMFALWGLSIWGLIHMMGGGAVVINGQRLYSIVLYEFINLGGEFIILKVDQVIHFYGFAVAALVIYQILALRLKKYSPGLLIFIAIIASMGLGALNEVVEFIAFISLEKTGVGDLYNLGLDLIFNLAGAIFGSFFASFWYKIKNPKKSR